MNKERMVLAIMLLICAYLLGYNRVTPAYLYSLGVMTQSSPVGVKIPQSENRIPATQPTPWSAPEVAGQ